LIDELQELFKEVLGELEELDFKEIESDLSEKIDDILVILKSSVRVEISKRASQLLSHSTFADGITPRVFGPQQRQPRHRAKLLPPLELPKFAGSYANGPHQRRKVAASTIMVHRSMIAAVSNILPSRHSFEGKLSSLMTNMSPTPRFYVGLTCSACGAL